VEWGIFYYNQYRWEEALACFEQALRINPHNEDALWNQGDALVNLEHYDEALEVSEALTSRFPDRWQAWYNRAWCCEKLELFDQVITAARQVIQLCPDNEDGYELLGNALLKKEKYDEALQAYDKALGLCPTYWSVWASKGLCLLNLERYEEALPCFETALADVPDDYGWWNSRGVVLYRLGRDEEALECYRKALDLCPDYVFATSNMADVYQRRKEYALAEQLYLKAYHLDPTGRRCDLFDATWCMYLTQRYKEMVPHLLAILPYAQTDNLHVAYRLAMAYKSMHMYHEAIDYYTLDIETFPNDPGNNASWLNIASCEEHLKHYEKAESAWKKALELHTDDDFRALCLYGLGILCGKQKRYTETVEYLQQSLALDPDFDECRQALGKARRRLKP
jgi:superkiller protein 3